MSNNHDAGVNKKQFYMAKLSTYDPDCKCPLAMQEEHGCKKLHFDEVKAFATPDKVSLMSEKGWTVLHNYPEAQFYREEDDVFLEKWIVLDQCHQDGEFPFIHLINKKLYDERTKGSPIKDDIRRIKEYRKTGLVEDDYGYVKFERKKEHSEAFILKQLKKVLPQESEDDENKLVQLVAKPVPSKKRKISVQEEKKTEKVIKKPKKQVEVVSDVEKEISKMKRELINVEGNEKDVEFYNSMMRECELKKLDKEMKQIVDSFEKQLKALDKEVEEDKKKIDLMGVMLTQKKKALDKLKIAMLKQVQDKKAQIEFYIQLNNKGDNKEVSVSNESSAMMLTSSASSSSSSSSLNSSSQVSMSEFQAKQVQTCLHVDYCFPAVNVERCKLCGKARIFKEAKWSEWNDIPFYEKDGTLLDGALTSPPFPPKPVRIPRQKKKQVGELAKLN